MMGPLDGLKAAPFLMGVKHEIPYWVEVAEWSVSSRAETLYPLTYEFRFTCVPGQFVATVDRRANQFDEGRRLGVDVAKFLDPDEESLTNG